MSPDDVVALAIPLTWLVALGVEALAARHAWPAIRAWRLTGAGFFVVVMSINALLPMAFPARWREHALLPVSSLGAVGATVVGFLALTLANALVHRAYHRFDLLWRWIHQLHHAPQRVDVAGAVVFTPWEIAINVTVFQLVVTGLLGLAPLPAAVLGYVSVFYGIFQHVDVRTPRWLGWVIQRPESHCVHHRRGMHAWNYADFPLWDVLMGTFRNPREFHGDVGFEGPPRLRIGPLLAGRDVNAALYGPGSRGSSAPGGNPA